MDTAASRRSIAARPRVWLEEADAPLGDLASRLGYQSEAAFSRAFTRFIGVSPGAARRNGDVRNGRRADRGDLTASRRGRR